MSRNRPVRIREFKSQRNSTTYRNFPAPVYLTDLTGRNRQFPYREIPAKTISFACSDDKTSTVLCTATVQKPVRSKGHYCRNWRALTSNLFKGFDWKHLVVAGGAALFCALDHSNAVTAPC